MRAIYFPITSEDLKHLEIKDEDFLHLVQVLRVKVGEKIKVLAGEGVSYQAIVKSIQKKYLEIELGEKKIEAKAFHAKVFCGLVKKEALSDILKAAVELSVSEITFIETEYSQRIELNEERIFKLLKSAMEQSNNPYLPKVEMGLSWKNFLTELKNEEKVFFMHRDIEVKKEVLKKSVSTSEPFALVLGPEGGFSSIEIAEILNLKPELISLPTAILRSPTALSAGLGWILAKERH